MYQIDNQSRQAIYEQIVTQVERYVLTGVFVGGEKMPSVRNLSLTLNVNPNTVQRAYTELERAGVIITAPGRGAFISDEGTVRLRERRKEMSVAEFRVLIAQLKEMGLDKTHIVQIVEETYQEENHD